MYILRRLDYILNNQKVIRFGFFTTQQDMQRYTLHHACIIFQDTNMRIRIFIAIIFVWSCSSGCTLFTLYFFIFWFSAHKLSSKLFRNIMHAIQFFNVCTTWQRALNLKYPYKFWYSIHLPYMGRFYCTLSFYIRIWKIYSGITKEFK